MQDGNIRWRAWRRNRKGAATFGSTGGGNIHNAAARTLLAVVILGGTFATVAPPASATHWCDSIVISATPTSATAEDRTSYAVTVLNRGNASLDLSIRVKFPWDAQPAFWGTMTVAAARSETNVFSKYIPNEPGEQSATITVQGSQSGEVGGACPAVLRPFRVDPAPPPLAVVILPTRAGGAAPLDVGFAAQVTGGTPPIQFAWAFGDEATGNQSSVNHTFATPGVYLVQVVAQDARGQFAVDRVTLTVSGADGASTPTWVSAVGDWSGVVLLAILVVAIVAVSRPRARIIERQESVATQDGVAKGPVGGSDASSLASKAPQTPPAAGKEAESSSLAARIKREPEPTLGDDADGHKNS
ncbi:MAG TPA: PKD domain-containing protein [Candidatus Thermoplasmatota archaeon]